MQTFVPSKSLEVNFTLLDKRRLNKNLIESLQILDTISGNSNGWKNHPAIKMWVGYEKFLHNYIMYNLLECEKRNIKTLLSLKKWENYEILLKSHEEILPSWWNGIIHRSHCEALKFKGIFSFHSQSFCYLHELSFKDVLKLFEDEFLDYMIVNSSLGEDEIIKAIKANPPKGGKSPTEKIISTLQNQMTFYNVKFVNFQPRLNYYWPR